MNDQRSSADAEWGLTDATVSIGHQRALRGVSLAVRPTQVLAVVGGDGAGKTTLLRALAGSLPLTGGSVSRPPEQQVGYVSAAPGGYGDLTVKENLTFSARAYGVPAAERQERIDRMLERTQLVAARDQLAERLSGGMRRKLALAMAVLHRPRLLILDEPTTGVDPVGRAELWRLLGGLAVDGTALVLSTTYLDEAERASRVLVLDAGLTLLDGTPDELIASVPGAIGESQDRPSTADTWRHARSWRSWWPSCNLGPGVTRIQPRLEEAMIVAQLAAANDRQTATQPTDGVAA
jgi:ABC-2 type transport system ATP-binding protein